MLRLMKKRWPVAVAVVGLGALAVLLADRRSAVHAVFQGKSVKSWALQFYAPSSTLRDEAAGTFRTLGSNAVPALVHLLGTRDSFLRIQLRALTPKLPARARPFVGQVMRGPDAAMVRAAAARSLAAVGP